MNRWKGNTAIGLRKEGIKVSLGKLQWKDRGTEQKQSLRTDLCSLRQVNKDLWIPEETCPCVLLVSFVALHLCFPSLILLMLSALPWAFPRKCTHTKQYPPTPCHPSLSHTIIPAPVCVPWKLITGQFSAERHLRVRHLCCQLKLCQPYLSPSFH